MIQIELERTPPDPRLSICLVVGTTKHRLVGTDDKPPAAVADY